MKRNSCSDAPVNLRKKMALYQWITSIEHVEVNRQLFKCLQENNLELDPEISNGKIIYARDGNKSKCAWNTRVDIIISPNNGMTDEYVVEVRSSEPMLKKGTRCEEVATILKTVIPPK